MSRLIARLAIAAVVAGIVAAIAVLVTSGGPPDGPQPIAWDREACAHCAMHVGEPAFAVQLQLADGSVLNFDDPGCYFWHLERSAPDIHATYFHSSEADAWLLERETAFVSVPVSPMGFGLAAVAALPARPGLLTPEAARSLAIAKGATPASAPSPAEAK